MAFQTYHFQVQNGGARVEMYVACARNTGGSIIVSYIKAFTHADLITQFQEEKVCKHCFVVSKCCKHYSNPRGLTLGELSDVQNGLLYNGYVALLAKMNTIQSTHMIESPSKEYTLTDTPQDFQ